MRARAPVLFVLVLAGACGVGQRTESIEAEPEPVRRPEWEWIPPPHEASAMAEHETYRGPPPECELGEQRPCFPGGLSPRADGAPLMMRCIEMADGSRRFLRALCNTPLVLSFDDAPVRFSEAPGTFAIGVSARTEWVDARTPWLFLDADGTGCVEDQRELFGGDATTPNGFEKLARLDDDGDGRIDARDAAYARLALWADRDQDRACSPGEVVGLADAGVVALDLAYVTPPAPRGLGSFEGERASFTASNGRRGRVVDVHLAPR